MSSKAIESKKNSLRILLSNQATLISRGLHSQEAKDSYAALSTQIADLESDLAMLAEIEARMAPDQAAAAQRATTDATVSVAERAASVAIRNVMPSFLPVEDNSRENIRVALRSLVRHGLSEARPEQRDLLTTSDAVGQAVIAQAYASEFLTYAKDYYAPLLNLVRTQYGTGYGTKITIASDLGVGASLVSENGPHTETDPTFSSHPVNTDLLSFGEIRFSNQLTADSGFDLIEQVLKPMYSRRFARGLEKAVLLGTDQAGTTLPNQSTGGLVAAATTTNSATASVVAADDLEVIYESLNDGYHPTAVWVMNQSTRNAIRKLKDSTGRYLLQPNPATGALDMLWGNKIVLASSMPSIATGDTPILFTSLQDAWFVYLDGGLRLTTTVERYAELNLASLIGSVKTGGTVLLPAAVQGLKIS